MWFIVAGFYGFYILKIINRNKGNFLKCNANISLLPLRVKCYIFSSISLLPHTSDSPNSKCQFIARRMKIVVPSCLEHHSQFRSCSFKRDILKLEYVQRIAVYVHCSLYTSTEERKVSFKLREVLVEAQMGISCL